MCKFIDEKVYRGIYQRESRLRGWIDLLHRGSVANLCYRQFLWTHLLLVENLQCWSAQRRTKELHLLESDFSYKKIFKNWICTTNLEWRFRHHGHRIRDVVELSIFSFHLKSRKTFVTSHHNWKNCHWNSPTHMSVNPWSHPLMTCPAPNWKVKGWSLS